MITNPDRNQMMAEIRDVLADGHPNPEGYLEWLESLSDSQLLQEYKGFFPTPKTPS
jgi:hypothetical protein